VIVDNNYLPSEYPSESFERNVLRTAGIIKGDGDLVRIGGAK
jgi:hypothetical protein